MTQPWWHSHPLQRVHRQDYAWECYQIALVYKNLSTFHWVGSMRFHLFLCTTCTIVKWLNCTLQSKWLKEAISVNEVFYAQYNDILYGVNIHFIFLRKKRHKAEVAKWFLYLFHLSILESNMRNRPDLRVLHVLLLL